MNEDKIYFPEEIDDFPIPQLAPPLEFSDNQGSGESITPKTTKEKPLPKKLVAVELLSSSLNTKSRNILAEYEFSESGALQIGKYEQARSGDIRISPRGIVARNKSGITTIAVDGETGDVVIAGILQAGSVIAGQVIVGNNSIILDGDENKPRILLYNNGIPQILIGSPD